jgi:hypothetical protein
MPVKPTRTSPTGPKTRTKQIANYKRLKDQMVPGNRGRPSKEGEIRNAVLRITEDKLRLSDLGVPQDIIFLQNSDLANYICAKTNNLADIIDGLIEEFQKEGCGARTKCDIANLLVNRVLGPANKPVFQSDLGTDGMIVVKWGTHREEPTPIAVQITDEGRVDAPRDTDTVCAS